MKDILASIWDWQLAGLLGLLVGSFLNVVIHRLPRMMEQRWRQECAELNDQPPLPEPALGLMQPRSRCPSCGAPIRWYQNIPLLSFAWLRGRCASCRASISWRYPLVEAITGILFAWVVARHGSGLAGLAGCALAAALVALAWIDWDTTLLPDDITLPLAWSGLIAAALGWTGSSLADSLWGAVAGYMSLWLINQGYALIRHEDGMGNGDFKLLAALGAWFGWQALLPIVLLASVSGAVAGILLKLLKQLREGRYVPFGPFLVLGGCWALLFGPTDFLQWMRP
ncbi:MAG: putative type 4 prepilin-like protein leader peptide processing enzyme [Pseudomonadota bacterium]